MERILESYVEKHLESRKYKNVSEIAEMDSRIVQINPKNTKIIGVAEIPPIALLTIAKTHSRHGKTSWSRVKKRVSISRIIETHPRNMETFLEFGIRIQERRKGSCLSFGNVSVKHGNVFINTNEF